MPTARGFSQAALLAAFLAGMQMGISPVGWSAPLTAIRLTDVTDQSGITFRHSDGGSGRRYLVEAVSAGLALFDYDGDGDIDIYFLNGAPLRGTRAKAMGNALYRNDGAFKFTDVSRAAGVADEGFGLGVAVGDYDNDGDPDLYLNNYGPNVLYRNNGDGTFTDVSEEAGVANGNRVGAGACFLDMDADGDLDLYAANYVAFAYEPALARTKAGYPIYGSPRDYPLAPDTLFRNNGNGTFTDVSRQSGIAEHPGSGMGTLCVDYDDDGDSDIFVANDVAGNFLFRNDGTGRFEEVGLISGFGFDMFGDPQGSMGIDCGDFDNDGRLDFHLTSYAHELACLYRNTGDGLLEDVTLITGAGAGTVPDVTWGQGIVDFDNDGDRDIFLACGHVQDNVEKFDDATRYWARNILMMNTGDGSFTNVSDQCGSGLEVQLCSRGAAFDDLDNDGDIDAVILNSRREPTLLRNDTLTRPPHHWVGIRLRGRRANRDGVGSRVTVIAGDLRQTAEVHSGRGYQSHFGTRLHFGLAGHKTIDRVEVRWLGGKTSVHSDIPIDRFVIIEQPIEPESISHKVTKPRR